MKGIFRSKPGSAWAITRVVIGIVVLLLTQFYSANRGSSNPKKRIFGDFYFGQGRSKVFSTVESDSRIRYLNPASLAPLSVSTAGAVGPNSSSILLWELNDRTFRLIFLFFRDNRLYGIRLQVTSYSRSRFPQEVRSQRDILLDRIIQRHEKPETIREVTPSDLKYRAAPVWSHKWEKCSNKPNIKLGYTRDDNFLADVKNNRKQPKNDTGAVTSRSGFYTVLKIIASSTSSCGTS